MSTQSSLLSFPLAYSLEPSRQELESGKIDVVKTKKECGQSALGNSKTFQFCQLPMSTRKTCGFLFLFTVNSISFECCFLIKGFEALGQLLTMAENQYYTGTRNTLVSNILLNMFLLHTGIGRQVY